MANRSLTYSYASHKPYNFRQGACIFYQGTVKYLTIHRHNESNGGSLWGLSSYTSLYHGEDMSGRGLFTGQHCCEA